MALRSLSVMLKALPRQIPGSRTFAAKGNPWSKSSTKRADPTKYGSREEMDIAKICPEIAQNMKRRREESERYMRIYSTNAVLIGIGCAYVWHLASRLYGAA